MRTYNIILLFILMCINITAQETYRSGIARDDIKSLEIRVEGEMMSAPFIDLDGEKSIEISFDALHHTGERFTYSVIHCDADWKQSMLIPVEYMRGFQNVVIDDYESSIATTTNYTNYRILFPNPNTQFLVSGNYAVNIHDEDNPSKIVLTACFSVVEPLVDIDALVSGNTNIDFNKEHQQLEFTINKRDLNITFPQTDLKISVYQNNNINDVRTNIQPMAITNRQLQYKNNRALIFEAGNEYRRVEFVTHRYTGMGVESIDFFNPYYHVTLLQDRIRSNRAYIYDQDQNSRFFINCSGCQSPYMEADYYIVHFSIASPPMNGNVYILGDMFNNNIDDNSLMEYNAQDGAYEKSVMLKQGLYNYQYAYVGNGETKPTLKALEGNFYETENEYTIAVYFRPAGARYDRLICVKNINHNRSNFR